MRSDMKRLGPEEYLNDTLIEFGLKYKLLYFNITDLLMRPSDSGLMDSERRIQPLQIRFMYSAHSSTRNSTTRRSWSNFFLLAEFGAHVLQP